MMSTPHTEIKARKRTSAGLFEDNIQNQRNNKQPAQVKIEARDDKALIKIKPGKKTEDNTKQSLTAKAKDESSPKGTSPSNKSSKAKKKANDKKKS